MTRPRAVCVVLTALVVNGCSEAPPKPAPHYVLGAPYRAGSVWFYPRESDDLDETGLATIVKAGHAPLTSDGEVFDQTALAAGHSTLQLPAIARITNLENGLQVTVRLNDRGSGDPHRLVEITRRTGVLLGISGDTVARVRLQVLPIESQAAAGAVPGAPKLAMSAAPRETVEVAELAPPIGAPQRVVGPGVRSAAAPLIAAEPLAATIAVPPLRLPEVVVQTAPQPGRLMVRLDTFGEHQYAAVQQAKMSAAGARIVSFSEGRTPQFRVEIGPLQDVSSADAVLNQALASGILDARIVID